MGAGTLSPSPALPHFTNKTVASKTVTKFVRTPLARLSSASEGLADYSQVDMLGLQYKSVNFQAGKLPDGADWWEQTD